MCIPPRVSIGTKALFLEPFDRAFMAFSDYSEAAIKTHYLDQGLKNTWKPLIIMVYRL